MISSQYQKLGRLVTRGRGPVVAIIDSGLDLNHEVLRISDPSKKQNLKTRKPSKQLKRLLESITVNGIAIRLSHAHDYFDGTDKIKEAERTSHGMHVTGIAAGNPG